MQPLYSWLQFQLKNLARLISLDLGFILSDITVSQSSKNTKNMIFPWLKDKKLHPFTYFLTDSKPLSDN